MNWPATWAVTVTVEPDALVLSDTRATFGLAAPAEAVKLRL